MKKLENGDDFQIIIDNYSNMNFWYNLGARVRIFFDLFIILYAGAYMAGTATYFLTQPQLLARILGALALISAIYIYSLVKKS